MTLTNTFPGSTDNLLIVPCPVSYYCAWMQYVWFKHIELLECLDWLLTWKYLNVSNYNCTRIPPLSLSQDTLKDMGVLWWQFMEYQINKTPFAKTPKFSKINISL